MILSKSQRKTITSRVLGSGMEDYRNEIGLIAQKHRMQDAGQHAGCLCQVVLLCKWSKVYMMVNGLPVDLPRLGSNTAR